ncbi:DNA/RNA helicase domain-containing protein [Aeromicrobium sp.]|uniref:DNA/RNA helicase domain-containing protein n=1 Tax=Aeromicrobium sp. TaxID=1871063 RepID=UPI0030BDA92F
MTSFRVDQVPFRAAALAEWAKNDPRSANWPIVYTIDGGRRVYVGESIHAVTRMHQHLARPERDHLDTVRVVIDPTFNKSVCLDLESFLIALFAGDGKFQVDNANAGLTGSNYYDRDLYREQFRSIFDHLRADGMFDGSITEIENSDLFKLSPFKTLNYDQRVAVLRILEQLLDDLRSKKPSTAVIQGHPGTGKTIVGIYLMKLLSDIRRAVPLDGSDSDAVFSGFFTPENADLLKDFRMGLVIPQQSLRETVRRVFRKTSGLGKDMVLSPAQVGNSATDFDLLIVDEAHRLQQISATMALRSFRQINTKLFGHENSGNQLDWIRAKSPHQIFLLDPEQSIRPGSDLPAQVVHALEQEAAGSGRSYALTSQMRVKAGEDYVGYVRGMLSPNPLPPVSFAEYDFKLFDDFSEMRKAVVARDNETGLSRLLAGYAWEWVSKNDASLFDIEIGGERLQWNRAERDWVSSSTSIDEVGSIHTIQGYDLNYAGVIIGPDLRYDGKNGHLYFVKDSYFDKKGKQNNKMLGVTYSDDDLLTYVANIYRVLLTRGIRGTYVYVCDPELREYLADFIPPADNSITAPRSGSTVPDIVHPQDAPPADGDTFLIELGEPVAQDRPPIKSEQTDHNRG